MCLKSEGIQFPSFFVLLSFFSTWIPSKFAFFWCCFCFFSLVFVNQVFFVFFSSSLALFFASAPHSKTQEITSVTMVRSVSLFSRILSLSFLEKKRKRNTSRARKCPLYGRSFFARARYASFFLTRCGFSAIFGRRKSPLSPTKNEF